MEILFSIRGMVFLALFTALVFISMQIPLFQLVGSSNQSFTGLQFIAPIAGGFLGIIGIAAVAASEIINMAISGKAAAMLDIVRLVPILFGVYYFSQYAKMKFDDKLNILVPLLAIAAFWLTPVGQQAWYYALFWTIPIIVKFLPDRLFLRSLGATFTAHAVGGAFWVWMVPMTAAQYTALMPVTAYERLLMAGGITVSYVLFTNVLNAVDKVLDVAKYVNVEKRYVLSLHAQKE